MSAVDTIVRHNLISPGDRVAAAVSGGSDSMALIVMLLEAAEELGFSVSCVNVEHGIRGEASRADSAFVEEFCASRSVPLARFTVDAPRLARETGKTLEQAARDARYDCFYRLIREGKADRVAVAHHADDNAETVLMHLLRGCGVSGARGMAYDNGRGVIRPLLDMKKREILAFLASRGVPYREDATNEDVSYARNFVRRELLPLAESRFPGAKAALLRFAAAAAGDDDYLAALAERALSPAARGWELPASLFSEAPPVAARALRTACRRLGVFDDLEAVHVRSAAGLAATGRRGARVTLAHGVSVYLDGSVLTVVRDAGAPPIAEEQAPFAVGSTRILGRTIRVERAEELGNEPGALYIAETPALSNAVWRSRKTGDTFKPYGGGTKKLNGYLSEKRIPARARDAVPLLATGSRVLVVAGIEIADSVKVTPGSRILKIRSSEE